MTKKTITAFLVALLVTPLVACFAPTSLATAQDEILLESRDFYFLGIEYEACIGSFKLTSAMARSERCTKPEKSDVDCPRYTKEFLDSEDGRTAAYEACKGTLPDLQKLPSNYS